MYAAVVRSFGAPPAYERFDDPEPTAGAEMLIEVLAAARPAPEGALGRKKGLTTRALGRLPMIPGVDGIGRDPEGRLRYFILDDPQMGSMAEQVVIDPRRSVPLPAGTDVLSAGRLRSIPQCPPGSLCATASRCSPLARACSCSAQPAARDRWPSRSRKHLGARPRDRGRPQSGTARPPD